MSCNRAAFFCSQGYSESPDLEFEYADTDKWAAELSGKGLLLVGQLIGHGSLSLLTTKGVPLPPVSLCCL